MAVSKNSSSPCSSFFYHSCLSTPLDPVSRMPSPGYERRPTARETAAKVYQQSSRATPSPIIRGARNSRASSATPSRSRISSATTTTSWPNSGRSLRGHEGTLTSLGPMLSFYESIPDYSELGHLPDREFYAKVRELRLTYQTHVQGLGITSETALEQSQHQSVTQQQRRRPRSAGSPKKDRLESGVRGVRCILNRMRGEQTSRPNSGHLQLTNSPLLLSPSPLPHRPSSSQRASPERPKNGSRKSRRRRHAGSSNKTDLTWASSWELPSPFLLDDSEEEEEGFLNSAVSRFRDREEGRRLTSQHFNKNVAWREPQFTVPQPFQMTRREEDERYIRELHRQLQTMPRSTTPPARESGHQGRSRARNIAHQVPDTSRLPLFHAILLQQEMRRERGKRRSKARLLSQMRPFSFDDDPNLMSGKKLVKLRRTWQSSPELRELSRVRGGAGCSPNRYVPGKTPFRARPMPRHLYGVEATLRHQEEDYLRLLRRKLRAEELLCESSLPASMSSRTLFSHPPCRPSTATAAEEQHFFTSQPVRQHSAPVSKRSGSHHRATSPYCAEYYDEGRTFSPPRVSPYKSLCTEDHPQPRPSRHSRSGSVSPIRHNLAAVLRIESCRRRAEVEAARQLEAQRSMEESRARARIMRRRPAWRLMAQTSARRELAIRAVSRHHEEQSRQLHHAELMGRIMNRVRNTPTLFERQAQHSLRHRVESAKEQRRCNFAKEKEKARPLSAHKFIAPVEQPHISFYTGTPEGEEPVEKYDEPEFEAAEKQESESRQAPEEAISEVEEEIVCNGASGRDTPATQVAQ